LLDRGRWLNHTLAALRPGKRNDTHCTGGWVGPRAGLYGSQDLAPKGILFPDRPVHIEPEIK